MQPDLKFRIVAENASAAAFAAVRGEVKSTETAMAAASRQAKLLSGALLGALSFAGISMLANKIGEAASELGDLQDAAERAGVSGEKLQIIGYALEKTTGSAEQANSALAKFNTTLGQAQVNDQSEQANSFRRLGVSIEDASGKMRGTEAVLDDVLKSLASIPSSAQRAALAAAVFGKAAGPDMAAMLANGGRALADAREHGVQFSNDLIDAGDHLDHKLKDLGRTWDTVWKTSVVTVATAAEQQIEEMHKISESLDDLVANPNWQTLKRFLVGGTDPHGADKLLSSVNSYIANIPDMTGAPLGGALGAGAGAADLKRAGGGKSDHSYWDQQAESIAGVYDALRQQHDALTMTDREQAIANNLAQAHVTAASADGQAIAALTGQLYDQQQAMKAFNDVAQFAGDTIYNAFDSLIIQGDKATDVIANMAKALAQAVLQATLLGQGPLAGIFGTAPATSGGVGGLVGSIFSLFTGGHASGGFIPKGMFGTTGDNETLIAGRDGVTVIPPRRGGSVGGTRNTFNSTVNITVQGSSGDAQQDARYVRQVRDVVRATVLEEMERAHRIGGTFNRVP